MMKLGVITTWKCNLKCKHCIFECPKEEELKYSQFEEVVLKLIPFGLTEVCFSGGEPILNKDFPKMLELTYKNNIYFRITSNALKYEKYLKLIQDYKKKFIAFHFSLDGLKKIHDEIRKKGSFDKVIEAIVFYKMIDVNIVINLILNKKNYNEIEDIIEYCSKLGVYGIKLGAIVPTKSNKPYQISFEKREKVFDNIPKWSKEHNIKIVNTSSLWTVEKINFCQNINNQDLNLNQRGELTFCCNIPGSFGKLGNSNEKIIDILEKKKKFKQEIITDRNKNKFKLINSNRTCYYCQKFFNVS